MRDSIQLRLTKQEAIALRSFLMRFRDQDELSVKTEADLLILYDLCAMVQNELATELSSANWNELLNEAQAAVIAGGE